MITWLKLKHRKRKVAQQGYRRPPDNGDSGVRSKRSGLTDKQKQLIYASQPDVVVVVDAVTGHKKTVRTPKKGIRTS